MALDSRMRTVTVPRDGSGLMCVSIRVTGRERRSCQMSFYTGGLDDILLGGDSGRPQLNMIVLSRESCYLCSRLGLF